MKYRVCGFCEAKRRLSSRIHTVILVYSVVSASKRLISIKWRGKPQAALGGPSPHTKIGDHVVRQCRE